METSSNKEEFQTVGLLCRETLGSLAQAVYYLELDVAPYGTSPSETDAKRMLEGYLSREVPEPGEERLRQAEELLRRARESY